MPEEMTAETTPSPEAKEPKESMWNLYTVMLFIAVGALSIAILLMLNELWSFHFDIGAKTAR